MHFKCCMQAAYARMQPACSLHAGCMHPQCEPGLRQRKPQWQMSVENCHGDCHVISGYLSRLSEYLHGIIRSDYKEPVASSSSKKTLSVKVKRTQSSFVRSMKRGKHIGIKPIKSINQFISGISPQKHNRHTIHKHTHTHTHTKTTETTKTQNTETYTE